MIEPDIPENEAERQAAVDSYDILDSPEEKEFDEITKIASIVTESPISLMTLIDRDRNWFKSHQGIQMREDPRKRSFCEHAINSPHEPFIIEDASKDERFKDNPVVVGEPHIRFYAGFPIVNAQGLALGALCVIDVKPKSLNNDQIEILKSLSSQSLLLMEHHKKKQQLEQLSEDLIDTNKNLELFAQSAAHDIRSPLISMLELTKILKKYKSEADEKLNKTITLIADSAGKLRTLVDDILHQNTDKKLLESGKKPVQLDMLLEECRFLVDQKQKHEFIFPNQSAIIIANLVALKRIFINLFSNSLQHARKEKVVIKVNYEKKDQKMYFSLIDNGEGFPEKLKDRIFDIYFKKSESNKTKNIGLGLATVKSLVEGMKGEISAQNHANGGAEFNFHIPI